jgi:hypothetical protein
MEIMALSAGAQMDTEGVIAGRMDLILFQRSFLQVAIRAAQSSRAVDIVRKASRFGLVTGGAKAGAILSADIGRMWFMAADAATFEVNVAAGLPFSVRLRVALAAGCC